MCKGLQKYSLITIKIYYKKYKIMHSSKDTKSFNEQKQSVWIYWKR